MHRLTNLDTHFTLREGFTKPDWQAIGELVAEHIPESDWNDVYIALGRRWVNELAEQLGKGYRVVESENIFCVSNNRQQVVEDARRFFESARRKLMSILDGMVDDAGYGKNVVLMFASLDDYYKYVSIFHQAEGEFPASGGMCLDTLGYAHFAFPSISFAEYRPVFVHELTHAVFRAHGLPLWLEEALAQLMEKEVAGHDYFILDYEKKLAHQQHWNAETIQQFWSGDSWSIPDEGFGLSYNLAQIFLRNLMVDRRASRAKLAEFVNNADWRDAGQQAMNQVFSLTLGQLAAEFLGPGDWEPDSKRWPGWENKEDLPQDET